MAQLSDVEVQLISLVKKGANGEPIKLYKSADGAPEKKVEKEDATPEASATPETKDPTVIVVPEAEVKKEETPAATEPEAKVEKADETAPSSATPETAAPAEVSKSADIPNKIDWTDFNSLNTNPRGLFSRASWNLQNACDSIFWDDAIADGKAKILENIDQFKAYVAKILEQDVTVQKEAFTKEDKTEMTKEEVQSLIKSAIDSRVEELSQKVTKSEEPAAQPETPAEDKTEAKTEEAGAAAEVKKAEPEQVPAVEPVQKSAGIDVTELVKAFSELLTPVSKGMTALNERLGAIEAIKGLPTGTPVSKVSKSDSQDAWPEIHIPGLD